VLRPNLNRQTARRQPRATTPRRVVGELIAEENGHFTAADLLARAAHQKVKVGRATIFRTLDLLADQGSLERIDLPSGEHAYVACEPARHHHHVVCRACGTSAEVADSGLQDVEREMRAQTGFTIESHRLELFGLCPACTRAQR